MRIAALLAISVLLFLLGGCSKPDPEVEKIKTSLGQDLPAAKLRFKSMVRPNPGYVADGPAAVPPPSVYSLIRYPSPAGNLVAYLSPDPGDGKKHPAVVWAHGGFGGIGDTFWEAGEEQNPEAFRKAGFIMMFPSWRAENDNPGRFELFLGEVDDAAAAVDYVSKLPYVDPKRIYFAGHSTGGTITMLTAETTSKIRAAFSFGGAPDLYQVVNNGQGYNNTPFDHTSLTESYVRSPICFVSTLRVPTFYFEGEESFYPTQARDMERRARKLGKPFSAYIVAGGDHFNILTPLTTLIAEKIKADTGPTCNISFTQEEVQGAFERAGK
jgi:dienelactone hydrolase